MKIVEEQIPNLIRNQLDKQVISHLYDEVFPTVQKYIKKSKGVTDDAHDVFQDALIYFYNQVVTNKFDPKYKVYGYIYRLAINRWINKLNKDRRMIFKHELVDHFGEELNEKEIDDYQELSYDQGNKIRKFVSGIGEKCVEVLTLRIYGSLMYDDIVLRMGFSSEAAAKVHFQRCREKLVKILKNNPAMADQFRE